MTTTTDEKRERREAVEQIFSQDDETILAWLRSKSDSVLADLIRGEWSGWQGNRGFDRPVRPPEHVKKMAEEVDARREAAATQIHVALSRAYQKPRLCTMNSWWVLPCRTDKGTIGIVDIAKGIAWDLAVPCPAEAEDLGLSEEVYAGYSPEGTVVMDGKVVQVDGIHVEGNQLIRPTMPPGWLQIALPSWRGYKGPGHGPSCVVPEKIYTSDVTPPKLRAYGLRTCYGYAGAPCRYLDSGRKDLSDAIPFPWLSREIEHTDPRWWDISREEEDRYLELVIDWTKGLLHYLHQHSTEEEREPGNQRILYYVSDAVRQVLTKIGACKLWTCRRWRPAQVCGERLVDQLQYELIQVVTKRMQPVREAINWMPDYERDVVLKTAAIEMARSLLRVPRTYHEVLDDMAQIHVEDGPKLFD